jgi:hypothetical protein
MITLTPPVCFVTLACGLHKHALPEQGFCCLTCESPTEGEQAVRKATGEGSAAGVPPGSGAGFLPFPLLCD